MVHIFNCIMKYEHLVLFGCERLPHHQLLAISLKFYTYQRKKNIVKILLLNNNDIVIISVKAVNTNSG